MKKGTRNNIILWSAISFMILYFALVPIFFTEITSKAIKTTEKPKTIKEFVSLIRSTPVLQSRKSTDEAILQRELEGFFMDIPEVVWCKFVGNTIYVGFETYPHDGEAILMGAALYGNKAINFGCHVWAVHADQKNNHPYYGTFSGKWYDEVTARYGRFE